MSWTEELLAVYDQNLNRDFEDGEPIMLPLAHSTMNAQIEITIDENGEFMGASTVSKDDAVTVVPVTEDSATRSSGISPMPFADKLVYIAGDYSNYADGKRSGNDKYFKAYMQQLEKWKISEYTHPAVNALYEYLGKCSLMTDLIAAGVLKTDSQGRLEKGAKIAGVAQEDAFVRVILSQGGEIVKTWKDKVLQEKFSMFNESLLGNEGLCYATGEIAPITYKHPSKIRNSGDKAKLFSTNDESGFTYRGRFCRKEEAVAISYAFSQKIFNALRWLIEKQGCSFGSLTFVVWASALQNIPDITDKFIDDDIPEDDRFSDQSEIPTTAPMYMSLLKKCILGYKEKLELHTKVMLLGIDAATTGRLSLSFYSELDGSEFLENVEKWHKQTVWYRYSSAKKQQILNSFSLYEIIKCAFGTEQGKFIDCDKKFLRETILRLIPCVTQGRKLPADFVNALYYKASNPQSYENSGNHRLVLQTACGMIRKSIIDDQKNEQEDYLMAYDPNIVDRSYLFGCLLAIAEKAEGEALDESERGRRETNAHRYWSAFVQRPYQTWGVIYEKLNPYFAKLGKGQIKYSKRINEILGKMSEKDFCDSRRLEPIYLLGYSHYMTKMFDEDMKRNKEDN